MKTMPPPPVRRPRQRGPPRRNTRSPRYVLKLYIAGMTPRSRAAVSAIVDLCERELGDRYDLEVVDIYHTPARASEAQIVAAPTLVKELPLPLLRLIGDLAEKDKVLVNLQLEKRPEKDGKDGHPKEGPAR